MFNYIFQNSISYILIFLGIVGIVGTILLSIVFSNMDTLKRRMKQSKGLLPKNLIGSKLKVIAAKKVKPSKITEMERSLAQAGFHNAKYEDYLLFSIIFAVVLGAFFLFFLNNFILGIVFGIVGFFLPKQIIVARKNKRFETIDKQLGPFLQIVSERYENGSDMKTAIESTVEEFKGEQPLYRELERLSLSLNTGKKIEDMLDEFAERLGNPYAKRFADYYRIAADLGSDNSRSLVKQAFLQHDENRKNQLLIQKELQSCKSEGYMLLAGIPAIVLYQILFSDGYLEFMTHTVVGKVGTAVIAIIAFGAFWFLNRKIGAPLK